MVDIHKEMGHVTLVIISKSVLGYEVKQQGDEIGKALLTCMEYFNRLLMPFGELIEKIPILPMNKEFQRAKDTLDSTVYSMIREHRKNLDRGKKENRSPVHTSSGSGRRIWNWKNE